MKQFSRTMIMSLIFGVALSTLAFASDYSWGVYNVDVDEDAGYSLTLNDADSGVVSAVPEEIDDVEKDVYADVSRMTLSFEGTTGEEYMVFLIQGDDGLPTEDSLRYINQVTGSETTEFDIYPDYLNKEGSYSIYISSASTEFTEVATFDVTVPYVLGDVDGDGSVSSTDASVLLQATARIIDLTENQKLAADVIGTGEPGSSDASQILQKVARIIDYFPAEINE